MPDDKSRKLMVELRKKIKKILYSYLLTEDFCPINSKSIAELFLPRAIDKIIKEIKAVINNDIH